MAYAHLISETYLKDNSPLNNAVDASELYPFRKIAQETHIQGILGTCLYEDLMDKIIASKASPPTALTTNDLTLLYKVRDCLVWLIPYDALPFISTKIRNVGLVQQNGENLNNASDEREARIRLELKGKADHYIKLLNDYICQYSELYSEYNCPAIEKMQPNHNTSNTMGIVLDEINPDWKIVRKWFNT